MDILDNYIECKLCPNRCRVNRSNNQLGICNESNIVRVAYSGLHRGEEPPISGEYGSGMIFFSGCPLHCKYCQNFQISGGINTRDGNVGLKVSIKELAQMMLELEKMSANNINLVTPTHFIPSIVKALKIARAKGLNLPIVYNTSGYEDVDALRLIDDYIDLYLIDFKTLDTRVAKEFCGKVKYVDVITKVFDFLIKKHPKFEFYDEITTPKGLLVRHLVFPKEFEATYKVLEYYSKYLKDSSFLSLMVQFFDPKDIKHFDKVNDCEYSKLLEYLDKMNIENGFVQEISDNVDWVPDFKLDKPFPSNFCDPLEYYLNLKRSDKNHGI